MQILQSFFAIDSYQRSGGSSGSGLDGLETVNSARQDIPINGYRIIYHENNLPDSFSATAYINDAGHMIISYRGTDDQLADAYTGWITGGGLWYGTQAQAAVSFYKAALAEAEAYENRNPGWTLDDANITLTGHSLGGGLAGFVARLTGHDAYVFDNMPFERAANRALAVETLLGEIYAAGLTVEQFIDASTQAAKDIVAAVNQVLSGLTSPISIVHNATASLVSLAIEGVNENITLPILQTAEAMFLDLPRSSGSGANIEGHAIEGEVLGILRGFQTTPVDPYDGFFGGSARFDFDTILGTGLNTALGGSLSTNEQGLIVLPSITAHNPSLLHLHLLASDLSQGKKDALAFLGGALTANLVNDAVAISVGDPDWETLLKKIAYSSATGTDAETPYGTTADDAIFNDAIDAGRVLDGANYDLNFNWTFKSTDYLIRGYLAESIVHFAGSLAHSANRDLSLEEGFIRTQGSAVISVDYSDALWSAAAGSNFDATSAFGRAGVIDVFDYDDYFSGGIFYNKALYEAIEYLYGTVDTDIIERMHYLNASGNIDVDLTAITASYALNGSIIASQDKHADIIRLTDGVNEVFGSSRSEIIDAMGGNDTVRAGGGNDLIYGGDGSDLLDGEAGQDVAVFDGYIIDEQGWATRFAYYLNVRLNPFSNKPFVDDEKFYVVREIDSETVEVVEYQVTGINPLPRKTGNVDTLKGIEHIQGRNGLFDTDLKDVLGASETATVSTELFDASSSAIGVVSLTAPVASAGTAAEFSLNISTSSVGTQYKIALIIDVSGSMRAGTTNGSTRIEDAKNAYIDLIGFLKDQGVADVAEFSVIPFNGGATLYEGLSADEAISRISGLSAGGGTSFGPALSKGLEFFDGTTSGISNIAYFLSDGAGSGASTTLQSVADVRAFGIGGGANISQLNVIDSNSAVILASSSDLAASFAVSEFSAADVDRVEIFLNGSLVQTIQGDELSDNGAAGLTFNGSVIGLDPAVSDTLEAKVIFVDVSIPIQSISFEINDGATDAVGTSGDDSIAFSFTQTEVDAGSGNDTVLANNLDNIVHKTSGNGLIKTFGGDDKVFAGDNSSSGLDRVIDGGDGEDTVSYVGSVVDYLISRVGGILKVGTNTDTLTNVEFLEFDDALIRTSDLARVGVVSVSDIEITEKDAAQTIQLTLSLDAPSNVPVVVDFETANGTALVGSDFAGQVGSVTFTPGETERVIEIEILGDMEFEESERFNVIFSNANGAVFQTGKTDYTATVTILDNDPSSETIVGTDGDDIITTGKLGDLIDLVSGNDILQGKLSEFFDDTVSGFGADDLIWLLDTEIVRDAIGVTQGSAILDIDDDGDGSSDGSFTLEGDFTGGDFMAARLETGTQVTFETFLASLNNKQAVNSADINGIVNAEFLNGHNVTDMTVTFEANASAGFDNSIGFYEIDPSGNLLNVTILAVNAKTSSGPINISVSDPDNDIGFFLVQDGANKIAGTEFEADDFEFVSDGAGGFDLSSQGAVLSDVNVFFSHDAALNPDGMEHVLSGVSDDGEGALRIGFEDLMRNGKSDDDFQDVILYVDIA